MIHYLRGTITMSFDGGIVVETGGVGYKVFVPDNSPLYTGRGKDQVIVYTVMIVREDDMSLYGFHDNDSLNLFQQLRTVNGVGAKAALSILSSIPVDQVKKAIIFEDVNALTKAVGVGKKTAQRIVLELKDKISDIGPLAELAEQAASESGRTEAVNALIGLGYSRSEAVSAVGAVEGENLATEEYIRLALRGAQRK
ncbi:MAG: Holliday junction branch migration protein RuvA [Clostridiales bacterium]|nr:Holliday junction branch migration protein RuvA [Clostridiales bacterium]